MSNNDLYSVIYDRQYRQYERRVTNVPTINRPTVLNTALSPLLGFDRVTEMMRTIKKQHPQSWYLHYKYRGSDPREMVLRAPSIIRSFNKSRVLRRARISGLRMCNLDTSGRANIYTTDMVVASTFDAIMIASAFNAYDRIDQRLRVAFRSFEGLERKPKREIRAIHDRLVEKFWRRSKLSRHSCIIEIDEHYTSGFGISWLVTSEFSVFDIACKIIEALFDDIDSIYFGSNESFEISQTPTAEDSDYLVRSFDKVTRPFLYRHYSAFGIYHNHPEFPLI